jgi:hypothetical protein
VVLQMTWTALLMPLTMISWSNRHYRAAHRCPPLQQHTHPALQPLLPLLALLLQVPAVAPGLLLVAAAMQLLCRRPLQGVGRDLWCLVVCCAVGPSSSSVTRGLSGEWLKVRPPACNDVMM